MPPKFAAKSRSAARRVALADISDRLPPAYFHKGDHPGADAATAGTPGSSNRPPVVPPRPGQAAGNQEPVSGSTAATGLGAPLDTDAPPGQAVEFQDLPSRIRDPILLSISMLLYSGKPDERSVTINGFNMREGQEVSAGLRIEEITPDGAIFSYQGYRFHKAVRGS